MKHKSLIVLAVTVIIVVVAYLVYEGSKTECAGIFQQTAPKISTSLETIRTKGELVVGSEKIQELTESAQMVGQHLKTCCIALEGGKVDPAQFQQCIGSATAYQSRIIQVVNRIDAAEIAAQRGDTQQVEQAREELESYIRSITADARSFEREVGAIQHARAAEGTRPENAVSASTEQEPNDTILQGNPRLVGEAVIAEVSGTSDEDYFKFQNSSQLRDRVKVAVENRSTTLKPWVKVYDKNKSEILSRYNGNPGANLEFILTLEPGSDYHLQILPYDSHGKYSLSVVPQRAFDRHEPNDDPLSAPNIQAGQVIAANIMDEKDADWYKLTGIDAREVTVKMENRSATLKPWVKVYDKHKSEILSQYNGTPGANLEFTVKTEPGSDYYLHVLPYDSHGNYQLSAR
jgi:hypothetical protein